MPSASGITRKRLKLSWMIVRRARRRSSPDSFFCLGWFMESLLQVLRREPLRARGPLPEQQREQAERQEPQREQGQQARMPRPARPQELQQAQPPGPRREPAREQA